MDLDGWGFVVSSAAEVPPPDFYGDKRAIHLMLDDVETDWAHDPAWCRAVLTVAGIVAERVSAGQGPVLVACHMGHNRSGLITALALRHLGMDAREAVRAVRAARGPDALSNPSFVDAVLHLPVKQI